MKQSIKGFEDIAFLYFSREDGCWIAHSLRTDQIGTGDDVTHALAALIRGVDQLLALAANDESIAYLREAPKDVQDQAAASKPLPTEIYEVAYKLAHGTWPEEFEPQFKTKRSSERFKAEIREGAGC